MQDDSTPPIPTQKHLPYGAPSLSMARPETREKTMIRLPRDPKTTTPEQALAKILEHLADAMEAGAGELRIQLDENYSHRPRRGFSDGIAMKVEFGIAYCALIAYFHSYTSTTGRPTNPGCEVSFYQRRWTNCLHYGRDQRHGVSIHPDRGF